MGDANIMKGWGVLRQILDMLILTKTQKLGRIDRG